MHIKKLKGALGIGLSVGLVFGLIAAAFVSPVAAGETEWTKVNTPSWEDLVILPDSDILDYDVGGDGDIVYAILELDASCTSVGDSDEDFALVKSDDGGVTWSDITASVQDAANLPASFTALSHVAVTPDDEDWLAVVGIADRVPAVVASMDGGSNFSYTGAMDDAGDTMDEVYDLAVSIEVDDIHNIVVAGISSAGGSVFRLKAGTWLSAAWEDTTDAADYLGWDNGLAAGTDSDVVVAVTFSPNFDIDDTIVLLSADVDTNGVYYIQSGIWESGTGSWNDQAGFPNAAEIKSDGDTLWLMAPYQRCAGLALPEDYDGSIPGDRSLFIYVNAINVSTGLYGGYVFRIDNNTLSPVCGPAGDPLLASIDVHGDADTGKLMIGEYIQYNNDTGEYETAGECQSVGVWHTEELDFCCPQWDGACKNPSGPYMALVMYTPDGAKEYATTSGTIDPNCFRVGTSTGTPGDESAFSVSRDDAVSFNQLGLIDTDIDYLSDVAVCPDCSTIYLSTINTTAHPCDSNPAYDCDSVWRSYDDGATWERIYFGAWSNSKDYSLLLRLPCDAIEDCCDQDPVAPSGTIYLGIQGDDQVFYSRDCGQCWNNPPATKVDIQDMAVESENIVYILDSAGYVSKSTQYGRRWSDKVDTEIGSGHSITSCCDEGFLVVGGASGGTVAWSDDGADSFNLTDALPSGATGNVHVACDPACEDIIYAAVDGAGIFRTDVTSGAWDDLNAMGIGYTGVVVAREGTLYASSDGILVDDSEPCATKFDGTGSDVYSGVARNLGPCETACCGTEDWDYLICGLGEGPAERFNAEPTSLRLCGCLSAATNSILWAIDTDEYAVADGSDGTLWSYEDCAAKTGPTLSSPTDGKVLDCEPCAGCDSAPFTMKWERMCNACSYDIQIMDEDGNLIVEWVDEEITGDPPSLYVNYGLECGESYTWHVREANTSCECIHSPWSETWSFTVAVGAADAIKLLAPDSGAQGAPIENIGFSWTGVRDATSYSFVLSPNANLTGALASESMSTTAFNFVGPLEYDKAYYWQVTAWKDGLRLTTSDIGVFNTGSKPVTPTPPVVVEQAPAPVINIPPAQQITPTWIYAIIGIGAALAVVVIVLIVRTRRP